MDVIKRTAQAKNIKKATEWGSIENREMVWEKKNYNLVPRVSPLYAPERRDPGNEAGKITVDLKTVSLSATDLSEILRKFFA